MRILVLHSPYLSGSMSGENRVVEDDVRLLREGGHEVARLLPERRARDAFGSAREGAAAIWSRDANARVRRMIQETNPDIVHVHNLFPALSPSVLRTAGRLGAGVVMTLHNYRLLCLPATFLRSESLCEDCLGRLPWRGVVHACYRGSRAGSSALATSLMLHRTLGTFGRVDLYLAVSEFVREKHIQAGFPADRVAIKPNFAWATPRREGTSRYFAFVGRLSPEKGTRVLLDAWRKLTAPLMVIGDGPEGAALRADAPDNVTFRGQLEPAEIPSLLAGARALIVPSLCYEGAPRTVLEAYAAGIPVLASAIGGLPELVENGVSGLLVPPNDPTALANAVERLSSDVEIDQLGEGAWLRWRERFSPEQSLKALEGAYRRVLDAEGTQAKRS